MLDWDDLYTFLAIARHGSLSAAARALGVQQTTIGRRLTALEARAGARLLEKTAAGLVPTKLGEAILGNAERIEAETLAVERLITGRDIRLEGVVRITTVETLAVEILTPILAGLQAEHPGIAIELTADTRNLSLTRREADIALRVARLTQQDLAVRRVGEMASALYASPDYIARHGTPDLAAGSPGHRVITTLPDLMGLPEMAWLAGHTAQAEPALRCNSRYAQRAACLAGQGLACLSRYLGDATALICLDTSPPSRELWLAVHNDIRHTPRIRAVTDAIAAGLRRAAPRLSP